MNDNKKAEFIWRMFGSIISAFCREFGIEAMRKMIRYMADSEDFWNLQTNFQRMDLFIRPYQQGDHDFIEGDKLPPVRGKSELVKNKHLNEFLRGARFIAQYWASLPDKTPMDRCEGVVFTILVMIDGQAGYVDLPAIDLVIDGECFNKDLYLHENFYDYNPSPGKE